ncbi:MAG: hypothetical protein WC458_01305 [Patescibacteria group bacterium]|jgi:hypothetical protein
MSIFIGLLILVGGAFLTVRTEWMVNNFGRIAWFEEKLGSEGGSRLGYKLIGLIGIFIGIVVMTGSGDDLMRWLLGPILKYNQ